MAAQLESRGLSRADPEGQKIRDDSRAIGPGSVQLAAEQSTRQASGASLTICSTASPGYRRMRAITRNGRSSASQPLCRMAALRVDAGQAFQGDWLASLSKCVGGRIGRRLDASDPVSVGATLTAPPARRPEKAAAEGANCFQRLGRQMSRLIRMSRSARPRALGRKRGAGDSAGVEPGFEITHSPL